MTNDENDRVADHYRRAIGGIQQGRMTAQLGLDFKDIDRVSMYMAGCMSRQGKFLLEERMDPGRWERTTFPCVVADCHEGRAINEEFCGWHDYMLNGTYEEES